MNENKKNILGQEQSGYFRQHTTQTNRLGDLFVRFGHLFMMGTKQYTRSRSYLLQVELTGHGAQRTVFFIGIQDQAECILDRKGVDFGHRG